MSLGTRQTDQVKIVPDFGLIWLVFLTENKIISKKRHYFHVFTIFQTFVQKVSFLNFSKLKMLLMSISVAPIK